MIKLMLNKIANAINKSKIYFYIKRRFSVSLNGSNLNLLSMSYWYHDFSKFGIKTGVISNIFKKNQESKESIICSMIDKVILEVKKTNELLGNENLQDKGSAYAILKPNV